MNFNELIDKISNETFSDVIAIAPRKVRESLFSHYDIKTRGLLTLSKIKEKKEERTKKLHEKLKLASNIIAEASPTVPVTITGPIQNVDDAPKGWNSKKNLESKSSKNLKKQKLYKMN